MGPDPTDGPQDWWGQGEWDDWADAHPEPPDDEDDGE